MSTPIAGNPLLFPATFPIPDGGDNRNVASVNPAFEALAHRTAYLKSLISTLGFGSAVFVEDGEFTAPYTGVYISLGYGGGGGGGGGTAGDASVDRSGGSGGGGGGSQLTFEVWSATKDEVLSISIGAGGLAGTAGEPGVIGEGATGTGTSGSAGQPTQILNVALDVLANHPGAMGGRSGPGQANGGSDNAFASGGFGVPSAGFTRRNTTAEYKDSIFATGPGAGGDGVSALKSTGVFHQTPRPGWGSLQGFSGGAAGAHGALAGTNLYGGGGGGGGGAGPGGYGGDGGDGGDGNASGAGVDGGDAVSADDNTGAGGGGGGAGGNGTDPSFGGNGGNGGSGKMTIFFLDTSP